MVPLRHECKRFECIHYGRHTHLVYMITQLSSACALEGVNVLLKPALMRLPYSYTGVYWTGMFDGPLTAATSKDESLLFSCPASLVMVEDQQDGSSALELEVETPSGVARRKPRRGWKAWKRG